MTAGPIGMDALAPLPHGRTALRLTWKFLPPDIRTMVEERLGARVVSADSRESGFTPGFASVLTGANGEQLFVKAASTVAQRDFAHSYREEARKLRALGDAVPAPRLQWVYDEHWVVLGFEAVAARPPARPWHRDELDRALDLAEEIADVTGPAGAARSGGLGLTPLWEDVPLLLDGWSAVPAGWPHREEAADLATGITDLPDSDRFLHADLRDDNILLCADGRTLACDWNWPALGPAWLDLLLLLASAHGDGLPVDDLLASRALTRDVDPGHVDAWLAAFCGFMLASGARPVPTASPYLRRHAQWYAEATWSWLAQRRGWS